MTLFHERVTSRTMFAIVVATAVWMVVTSASLFAAGGFGLLMVLVLSPILIGVLWMFSAIDLSIDGEGLRASFRGKLEKKIALADIARVEAADYRWTEFLGWGLRGNLKGAFTYSIIGVKGSLRVTTKDGKTFVVSCLHPQTAEEILKGLLTH